MQAGSVGTDQTPQYTGIAPDYAGGQYTGSGYDDGGATRAPRQ